MEALKNVVVPSDCLLAIALPLTKAEFVADLDPIVDKDYVKSFCSRWGKRNREELWTKYRDSFSNLILAVTAEVEQLGVKVVYSLRIADVKSLFSNHRVVSIVSHWRGAYFVPDDIQDLPGFIERLKSSSEARLLRSHLSVDLLVHLDHFDSNPSPSPHDLRTRLTDELNRLLETHDLQEETGVADPNVQPLHEVERTYRNRIHLDEVFKAEIKGGNKMEFCDGLKPVELIRNEIPDAFNGILDLIVCNSVLPGEAIKLTKKNFLVMSNEFPAVPSLSLLVYKAVMKTLKQQPMSFINATLKVRHELANYLRSN